MTNQKIDEAIRLRLAYNAAISSRFAAPDSTELVANIGEAAGRWLAAEDALNHEEYTAYQEQYQAEKEKLDEQAGA